MHSLSNHHISQPSIQGIALCNNATLAWFEFDRADSPFVVKADSMYSREILMGIEALPGGDIEVNNKTITEELTIFRPK